MIKPGSVYASGMDVVRRHRLVRVVLADAGPDLFIVLAMGLKPSPSGETFRFFCYQVRLGLHQPCSYTRFRIQYDFA